MTTQSTAEVMVPEAVAKKLTGQKTRSVFERYNIVSGDDLREAALKLNAALQTVKASVQASAG
ncbi:MAG TPA: hypothetical protein VK886_16260 [Vicinamibacterales bacterium]|nr:hypothetical protein [Vicinamibacterales bacterium]